MRPACRSKFLPLSLTTFLMASAASAQCPPVLEGGSPTLSAIAQYHPHIVSTKLVPVAGLANIVTTIDPVNDARLRSDTALAPLIGDSIPVLETEFKNDQRPIVQFSGPISIKVPGAGEFSRIIEQDGKIIVVGGSDIALGQKTEQGVYLTRLQADGKVDTSFGQGGGTRIALIAENNMANNARPSVAISPGGKIVVSRSVTVMLSGDNPGSKVSLVRLDHDGSLDPTFGVGGVIFTTVQDQFEALSVAVLRDDKIIVAGESGHDGGCTKKKPCDRLATLVRYQSDGQPDPSFGIRGLVQSKFFIDGVDGVRNSAFYSVDVQDNGLILAAGDLETGTNPYLTPTKMLVAEYLPSGELNPYFGNGGAAVIGFDGAFETFRANSLALQDNGRILAGGTAGHYDGNSDVAVLVNQSFVVARLTVAGDLDGSFGNGGKVVVDVDTHPGGSRFRPLDDMTKIAITSPGDIYAVGMGSGPVFGTMDTAIDLVALKSDGSLNQAFGKQGVFSYGTFAPWRVQLADDALIMANGRLLVAGTHWPNLNNPDAFVLGGFSITPEPVTLTCPEQPVFAPPAFTFHPPH